MLSQYQDWGGGFALLTAALYYLAPMAGATTLPFVRRPLSRRGYWLLLALCAAPFLAEAAYRAQIERMLIASLRTSTGTLGADLPVDLMFKAFLAFRFLECLAAAALFPITARRLIDAGAPPWPAALLTPVPLLVGQYEAGRWLVAGLAAAALLLAGLAPRRRISVAQTARTFE